MSRINSTFQASNSSLFGRFVPLGNEGKDGLFTIFAINYSHNIHY